MIAARFRILSRLDPDLECASNKVDGISRDLSAESQGKVLLWEACFEREDRKCNVKWVGKINGSKMTVVQ